MEKPLCPECKFRMELYGISDRGEWKFCCPKCHRLLSEEESRELNTEKSKTPESET